MFPDVFVFTLRFIVYTQQTRAISKEVITHCSFQQTKEANFIEHKNKPTKQNYDYQKKVTSQYTMSHVQSVTGVLLILILMSKQYFSV